MVYTVKREVSGSARYKSNAVYSTSKIPLSSATYKQAGSHKVGVRYSSLLSPGDSAFSLSREVAVAEITIESTISSSSRSLALPSSPMLSVSSD